MQAVLRWLQDAKNGIPQEDRTDLFKAVQQVMQSPNEEDVTVDNSLTFI